VAGSPIVVLALRYGEFQLIGYFVKAEALPEHAPAFPPPLP
jgi:hypothetical protein